MRRFKAAYTLLTLMFACSLGLSAQTAADSVKIRLRTSPSAEIGLDGDVSSTNFLTTRTSVGKHKVTVTYGTDFVRTFDIEVTREETFEFNIEGKVTVNSLPDKRKVYLGSVEQGMTPLTLNVLGTHNLRVEGDALTYFDATERISISPYQELELSYTLGKRPPRLYGVMMANGSHAGGGLMLGIVRRWGWYARFAFNGYMDEAIAYSYMRNWEDDYRGLYRGSDEQALCMLATGLMLRFSKNLYAYVGGGWGSYGKVLENEYSPSYYENYINGWGDSYASGDVRALYGHHGPIVDGGLIFKWKALLLSAGYTRVLGNNYAPTPYHEINAGIGFTIHRNKKRK